MRREVLRRRRGVRRGFPRRCKAAVSQRRPMPAGAQDSSKIPPMTPPCLGGVRLFMRPQYGDFADVDHSCPLGAEGERRRAEGGPHNNRPSRPRGGSRPCGFRGASPISIRRERERLPWSTVVLFVRRAGAVVRARVRILCSGPETVGRSNAELSSPKLEKSMDLRTKSQSRGFLGQAQGLQLLPPGPTPA